MPDCLDRIELCICPRGVYALFLLIALVVFYENGSSEKLSLCAELAVGALSLGRSAPHCHALYTYAERFPDIPEQTPEAFAEMSPAEWRPPNMQEGGERDARSQHG